MKTEIKERQYKQAFEKLKTLIGHESGKYHLDNIGKMATIATVLKLEISYFYFSGFYRVIKDDLLQIGPYQGELIACGTIPFGKGVCGVCALKRETIIVEDVTIFEGYIACDEKTASEIVVPVSQDGKLIAVYDVDSEEKGAFDETDRTWLERILSYFFQ